MSSTTTELKNIKDTSDKGPGPLIVSLAGLHLSDKERKLLTHKNVGGLVLFRENYDKDGSHPKASLKKLIDEIRAINPNIIIMVDHEGGNVWRFIKANPAITRFEKGGSEKTAAEKLAYERLAFERLAKENEKGEFTKLPAAAVLGALYDKNPKEALKVAFNNGQIMAQELLDCGVDMSLAPVVDLDGESNVIGGYFRAFHTKPTAVTEITEHFIRGMNSVGMPATLKHYPGHGRCKPDSHTERPVDGRSIEELNEDFAPFKNLCSKPELNFTIMTAHVTYPAVDPEHTAGFSKIWIKGALRLGCGFPGVVMSDCLSMEGAAVGHTVVDRLSAAQEAGNDFQMYTHQHNSANDNKLDKLLAILDQIPDNKESMERRKILAHSIQRNQKQRDLKKIGPGEGMKDPKKEPKDKEVLVQFAAAGAAARASGSLDQNQLPAGSPAPTPDPASATADRTDPNATKPRSVLDS